MAIERGDIYLVDLNPVQGREQAGLRPVLVLSVNAINRLPRGAALFSSRHFLFESTTWVQGAGTIR
jgi:Growth inhibitor